MLSRLIALLCAAAMLGGLFLPWFATPSGESLVLWKVIGEMNGDRLQTLVDNAPPEVLIFAGSFALAALFLLVALVGKETKFLALVTGGVPLGLVAWAVFSASEGANAAGISLSGSNLSDLLTRATELFGAGAWAWIGGAALLALLGLVDPGRRRRA